MSDPYDIPLDYNHPPHHRRRGPLLTILVAVLAVLGLAGVAVARQGEPEPLAAGWRAGIIATPKCDGVHVSLDEANSTDLETLVSDPQLPFVDAWDENGNSSGTVNFSWTNSDEVDSGSWEYQKPDDCDPPPPPPTTQPPTTTVAPIPPEAGVNAGAECDGKVSGSVSVSPGNDAEVTSVRAWADGAPLSLDGNYGFSFTAVNGSTVSITTAVEFLVGGGDFLELNPSTTVTVPAACEEPPDKVNVPAQPGHTDPCGPNNATWNVPSNDSTFNWAVVNGDLVVTIVAENTVFTDGSTSHNYGKAPESGQECPPPPPGQVNVPAKPASSDPCGANNASWNVPADDATFDWTLDGEGNLSVKIVKPNTVFTDGSTSHNYGKAPESGQECPPTTTTPPPTTVPETR